MTHTKVSEIEERRFAFESFPRAGRPDVIHAKDFLAAVRTWFSESEGLDKRVAQELGITERDQMSFSDFLVACSLDGIGGRQIFDARGSAEAKGRRRADK